MRRLGVVACIVAMLGIGAPARAGSNTGHVAIATASPAFAHSAWETSRQANGVFGWVFRLHPGADDATYSMEVRRGATGVELLDVYFYEADGRGIGAVCPVLVQRETLKTETGVICPGPMVAEWGIAVLASGADARFAIEY